jgi:hypothetical protein
MKKLCVLFVAMALSVTAASAQGWGAGVRSGTGFQAVGQRYFANDDYLEMRLGMSWVYDGMSTDISAMYVWNVSKMDWTDEGRWFFDLGSGLNLGMASRYLYMGLQGMARLGYAFEHVPLRLSFDWSPSFGPGMRWWPGGYNPVTQRGYAGGSENEFNTRGVANFGVSCTYKF